MNREILFRGKSLSHREWVYGGYCAEYGDPYENTIGPAIIKEAKGLFSSGVYIHPETAGQYTGLKDKNGTKIFEGGIVQVTPFVKGHIIYFDGAFRGNSIVGFYPSSFGMYAAVRGEVVGNIHDNPELLKIA